MSDAPRMATRYITLNELVRLTGLPEAWLRREAAAGRIPFIRTGRRLRFNLEEATNAIRAISAAHTSRGEEVRR